MREIDYSLKPRGNDFIIPLLDVSQILWHYGFHFILIGRASEQRHSKGSFSVDWELHAWELSPEHGQGSRTFGAEQTWIQNTLRRKAGWYDSLKAWTAIQADKLPDKWMRRAIPVLHHLPYGKRHPVLTAKPSPNVQPSTGAQWNPLKADAAMLLRGLSAIQHTESCLKSTGLHYDDPN